MRRWLVWPHELTALYVTEGEEVFIEQAPNLLYSLVFRTLEVLVMFSLLIMASRSTDPVVTQVALAFAVGIFLWLLKALGEAAYTRYVLTNYRVLVITGLFERNCEWVSWRKVTDVSTHRSILDGLLGMATIRIHSAHEATGFTELRDVPNPDEFEFWVTKLVQTTNKRAEVDDWLEAEMD
ncbi:MAG TPA: hypothetical protein DEG43_07045 [Acidimicrobiaceae bacterium]|nr:hypothetical protein [Acidimicrobiaceae bacterium]